ncbi:MAG TPA: DNA polymerase III subunit delta [Candidatus Krumholzibacteria bacterium]|nr:DNA polymerase III subunit delta [Candidatus Krumholzibacteria bacterium]
MAGRLSGYKKLFDEVRQGRVKALYFLHGPEEYMKREFVRELVGAALPDAERTFNLDVLHGDEFDAQAFDDRLMSFPLFSARRVVILRNFEALSPSNRERVIERAGGVPDSMTLVVESNDEKLETAAHKKLAALAAQRGVAFAFGPLDESESLERALARFRREGVQIDPDALDLLVESVGTQLMDLANEIDKILLSASDTKTVTRERVASVVGKYRTESLFSLLDGVGVAAPATTLSRLSSLLDAGEEPVFVVAMMLRRVVALLEVRHVVAERGRAVSSDRALADSIAATQSPYFAGKLREQAARTTSRALETLLANLRWADLRLKTTNLDPKCLVEEALVAAHVGKALASPALAP